MKRRIIPCLALLALLLSVTVPAGATETEPSAPKPIRTVEDLLAIAEDPSGSYILMADLDMTGVEWKTLDFAGTFDGNGYAILNLTIFLSAGLFIFWPSEHLALGRRFFDR